MSFSVYVRGSVVSLPVNGCFHCSVNSHDKAAFVKWPVFPVSRFLFSIFPLVVLDKKNRIANAFPS